MSYYNDEIDEDEDTAQGMNNDEPNNSSSQPVQLSNQSTNVTPTVNTGTTAPTKVASSGSGPGFQNYAKANQGKAQDNLNSSVANNVANSGQAASKAITQATNAFGTKVDQGSLANRQNAIADVAGVTNAARNITAQSVPVVSSKDANKAYNAQIQSQLGDKYQSYQTELDALQKKMFTADNNGSAKRAAEMGAIKTKYGVSDIQQAQSSPLSSLSPDQVSRFKEVINAQYQGPESLRQAGLYNPAAQKVGTAQNNIDNSKTAMGREELLKNMYSQRSDYTTGLNKLDSALLNASEQGVKNLQNVAAQQGNIGQKLDQAQVGSANLAQNRTGEIKDIKEQARSTFTTGKKAEEAATEKRLASVVKDWDTLPNYFKDIIRNKEKTNQAVLKNTLSDFKKTSNYDSVIKQRDNLTPAYQQAVTQKNALANNQISQTADQIERLYAQSKSIAENGGVIDPAIERAYNLLQQQKQSVSQLDDTINKYNTASNNANNVQSQLADINDKFNNDAVIFNPFEAATLGVQSGEGLYNLGADAIKTGIADRNRLVSKDEQARQAALSSLAGLDLSNRLDTSLRYTNADKAGTQSILDSLDLAGTRKNLNAAEKGFRADAKESTLTGYGQKKNKSSGKRYYAEESANLKDLLSKSGYDFSSPTNSKNIGNADLLKALSQVSSSGQIDPANIGETAVDATAMGRLGLLPAAKTTPAQGAISAYIDPAANMGDGQSLGQNYADVVGTLTGASGITGALGMGSLGSAVGGLFGSGSSSKESKNDAAAFARQDLENKIQDKLQSTGFDNRVAVANNSAVTSRMDTLKKLLAGLDKTNA